MENLKENSCRICLTECQEGDPNFVSLVHIFEKLTRILVNEGDIPKKICDQCLQNLLHFEDFCTKCEETEQILERYRGWTVPVKSEMHLWDDGQNIVKLENESNEVNLIVENECKTEPIIIEHENIKKTRKKEKCSNPHLKDKELKRPSKKPPIRLLCCELCGKEFHSHYLKQHMRTHVTKAEPETYYCDLCSYTCSFKDRIRYHIRQKHLKVIRYDCKYCDRTYQDFVSLKFHTSNTHTKEFSHICEVCGKGYITKSRLENHAAKHSEIRKFLCNICGDAFKSLQYLGCHKREVHSDKVLHCTDCGKPFKCKKLLRQHQQFHRPQEFFCPICPQTFSVGQTLRGHISKSHPHLPLPPAGTHLRNLKDLDSYLQLCSTPLND